MEQMSALLRTAITIQVGRTPIVYIAASPSDGRDFVILIRTLYASHAVTANPWPSVIGRQLSRNPVKQKRIPPYSAKATVRPFLSTKGFKSRAFKQSPNRYRTLPQLLGSMVK